MNIPVQFPADMLAVDVQMWAISHGLRLKSDGHGNLVAVPVVFWFFLAIAWPGSSKS